MAARRRAEGLAGPEEVGGGHSTGEGEHDNSLEGRAPASTVGFKEEVRWGMLQANNPEDKVQRLQRALNQAAKRSPTRRFHALYDKVFRKDILERAWRRVRANKGCGGVDGATIEQVEREEGVETFLRQLQEELRTERYRPMPVKRVEIPKPTGSKRPLGIPAVRDRVVQAACRMVIEPIFEASFLDCSYGFRPGRSAHQAHEVVRKLVNYGYRWVVEVDIVKFFDTIDHGRLMDLVRRRISDRRILSLIQRWLKAGVLTEGRVEPTEEGTPQGGVISPLLANRYLHYVDGHWQKRYGHLGKLVRYADDIVVLCRTAEAARESLEVIKRLLGQLKLKVNPDKTKVVEVTHGGSGFDFLGFHFQRCMSRHHPGHSYCWSWPSRAAMRRICLKVKAITTEWWRLPKPIGEMVKDLNPVVRGWVNYFKVGNSSRKFRAIDRYVYWRVCRFLRRKHQLRRREPIAMDYLKLGVYAASNKIAWVSCSHAAG